MKKIIVILAIAALAYVAVNFKNLPVADRLAESSNAILRLMQTPPRVPDKPGSSPACHRPAPGNTTVAIRNLSHRVLQPLEGKSPISLAEAQETLAAIRANLASSQPQAAARANMALNLIQQALTERQNVARSALTKGKDDNLDKVPGDWHSASDRNQKIDLTANNQRWRAGFWIQAELNRWHERCAYYNQQIEQLLAE
jgi:hypothetical protein